jgi:hypothetical protein
LIDSNSSVLTSLCSRGGNTNSIFSSSELGTMTRYNVGDLLGDHGS